MRLKVSLIISLAERLDRAQRDRQEIEPLTIEHRDLTAAEAYAIQRHLVALREGRGDRIIGVKAGLTSRAKQEAMGVHEPIYGYICSDMLLEQEEPLAVKELIHPRAEPEIAFLLARDLAGPGITAAKALEATEFVAPAMEIIDSRYREFRFTLADVIADNASSGRVVLGRSRASPRSVDLRLVEAALEKNGEVVERGLGADVLGDPAEAVAWLANKLAETGQHLKAGDLVMPGALCNAHPLAADDVLRARFDGLGSVTLRCI